MAELLSPPREIDAESAAPAGARAGLAFALPSAEHVEPALLAFDGLKPSRQVLDELHAAGQSPQNAEHPESVELIRSLMLNGFLEVVG